MKVRDAMPLLAKHEGTWRGTYRHVKPDLSLIDEHEFRILVELPTDGTCAYRQTSHYWWQNGKTEDRIFEAEFDPENSRLIWDNGRISGRLWELDDTTLYLTFVFTGVTKTTVCEMMQLSPCGNHRARTWHWFENHQLTQITLVRETREG